jgi:type 1 glutamine amidotransferase
MKKLKVLLLVGGAPYHDKPEHRTSLSAMLGPAFDLTMADKADVLTPENLDQYDVVASYTSWWTPTDEQCAALVNAVRRGKGFAGLHPSTASFFNCPAYLEMIGSKFLYHDPFHTFSVYTGTARGGEVIKPRINGVAIEPGPITAGIEQFDIEDELFILEGDQRQWYVQVRAEGHPVVYLKHFGLGRVYMNTLGHDERSLNTQSVRELYIRGIKWAGHAL